MGASDVWAGSIGPPNSLPLAGYRVLDLTDERGLLAGNVFAKLGADVIQVEPPRGSTARSVPPLLGNRSFFWDAYAAGKSGITCNLELERGCELIRTLASRSDFLIESDIVGKMDSRGLGWKALSAINPRLIYVSITAFGSTGPKARSPASDLTLWAAAGPLLHNRDGNGPPLRLSVNQAYLHASVDAVGGALVALFAQHTTGAGQHVDISVQQCVAQSTLSSILSSTVDDPHFSVFELSLKNKKKPVDMSGSDARTRRSKWLVSDGLIELHLAMGPAGWSSNNFFQWMRETDELPNEFNDWDWRQLPLRIEAGEITNDAIETARTAVAKFLLTKTKQEILANGLSRRITMAPVATTLDLVESEHFLAREYLTTVEDMKVPGPFVHGGSLNQRLHRAPKLGEHNQKVYNSLGLDAVAVRALIEQGGSLVGAPLGALKVLDFCWAVAGPMVGRALSDYGATVVRIESGKRLDATRVMGPFPRGERDIQQSVLFENCNAGKYGVTLDMNRLEGLSVARDLAKWADIVIESFAPGQMAKWKLDYANLCQDHPDLIMLSTSLLGHSGPYARFAGFGNIGSAFAGFQALAGERNRPPIGPFGPYTDYIGPKFALIALLAAVEQRRTSGKGCWIDLSQVEAAVQLLAPQVAETSVTGRVTCADGNRDPQFAPHGVFQCRGYEKWIAVVARNDEEWRSLATLIHGAELVDDPRFRTLEGRKRFEDDLEALIAAFTAGQDVEQLEADLLSRGIAAHQVASSESFCADPQILSRGHLCRLAHPLMGEVIVEGSRFELSSTPANVSRCAPTLGRDNEYVLREFAGYDAAKIATLAEAGVLQ